MSKSILIVYYSRHGSTAEIAKLIGRGINMVEECEAVIRCASELNENRQAEKYSEHPIVTLEDLKNCCGLAIGSPSYFGGLAAPLKAFIDDTTPLWMNGTLAGKPACVFTSSGTLHGGQEMALMSMLVPLMHHGMLVMGLPYTQAALNNTKTGGTPYGPSHVAGHDGRAIDKDEKELCLIMGKRLALAACKLSQE